MAVGAWSKMLMMRRGTRGRRLTSNIGFVLLLLVLAGELAYAAWPSHKTSVTVDASSVKTPPIQTTVTPTTIRKIVRVTTTTVRVRTTTTTRPAVSPPVTGPGSVTYTVPGGTVVRLVANGRCWIQARRGSSGPVLDDVILKPGDTKTYTAPVWIRIGDTSQLTVKAGSTDLELPPVTGNLTINTA
jgi:RodZ C-terminal domain